MGGQVDDDQPQQGEDDEECHCLAFSRRRRMYSRWYLVRSNLGLRSLGLGGSGVRSGSSSWYGAPCHAGLMDNLRPVLFSNRCLLCNVSIIC